MTNSVLKLKDATFKGSLPMISTLDSVHVGNRVGMFGFPHCTYGRRVLTYQDALLGAKMLISQAGVKSKAATLNIQTRPGQSGSPVLDLGNGKIVGMLIGTFAPEAGLIIQGINPHELNQTSYCLSAEYISEML